MILIYIDIHLARRSYVRIQITPMKKYTLHPTFLNKDYYITFTVKNMFTLK
jgi:hypothetical protein